MVGRWGTSASGTGDNNLGVGLGCACVWFGLLLFATLNMPYLNPDLVRCVSNGTNLDEYLVLTNKSTCKQRFCSALASSAPCNHTNIPDGADQENVMTCTCDSVDNAPCVCGTHEGGWAIAAVVLWAVTLLVVCCVVVLSVWQCKRRASYTSV